MEVGQLADQVTVEATAVAVNTASGTTSQLLDGRDMVKLPSRGRNVLPFALLMPGVVSDTPYDRCNNRSMVNGIRPTHNAWLLDGGYNIDTGGNWGTPLSPNIETVAEFRAIRGNYSAEFGIGGGSQFNVITEGGTNSLQGSLYWFHRNDKLNARNFFSPRREPFKGNDYGFSLGGPAYIPKFYDGRNKTFFFVFLGWIEERREQNFLQIVPTAAIKQGDFSALGRMLYDPDNGQPLSGNLIPTSRIDRNAPGYAGMYPEPNFLDSAGRNWTALVGRRDDTNEKELPCRPQLQRQPSPDVALHARVPLQQLRHVVRLQFPAPEQPHARPQHDQQLQRHLPAEPDHGSHLRALPQPYHAVLARSQRRHLGINIPQLFADTDKPYPLTNLNVDRVPDRVPTISLTNYAAVEPGSPWSNYQTIYEPRDNFTWIKNKHAIKAGFAYSYEIKFEFTNTDVFGRLNFDGRFTRQPGQSAGGDAFADLLLGRPWQYEETDTVAFNDNRRRSLEFYVNDSFKVTRKLSLDFGVRWSYFPAATEPDDHFRVFVPSQYDPAKALTLNAAGQEQRGSGDRFNGLVNPK